MLEQGDAQVIRPVGPLAEAAVRVIMEAPDSDVSSKPLMLKGSLAYSGISIL